MILGTYFKKILFNKRKENNKNSKPSSSSSSQIPTIHVTIPTPFAEETHTSTATSNKMAFSRTASSSTTEYTNGYHTPTSPPAYTVHATHHGHEDSASASRQEYARILYEHTMKQMERFAQDAQSRGTLSMDHYPHQQRATASN